MTGSSEYYQETNEKNYAWWNTTIENKMIILLICFDNNSRKAWTVYGGFKK